MADDFPFAPGLIDTLNDLTDNYGYAGIVHALAHTKDAPDTVRSAAVDAAANVLLPTTKSERINAGLAVLTPADRRRLAERMLATADRDTESGADK